MKLSPRLAFIVENSIHSNSIIDIAADHGYVALAIKISQPLMDVIVSDIAILPLESAKKNFHHHGFDAIDFRLGSGLEIITPTDTIDLAIIAGIGGRLMVDLLACDTQKTKMIPKFILQANIGMHLVREWLYENGFHIVSDTLIADSGRIYECLIVKQSAGFDPIYAEDISLRELQFHFGTQVSKQNPKVVDRFLSTKKTSYQMHISQLEKAVKSDVQHKIYYYQNLLRYIEEVSSDGDFLS